MRQRLDVDHDGTAHDDRGATTTQMAGAIMAPVRMRPRIGTVSPAPTTLLTAGPTAAPSIRNSPVPGVDRRKAGNDVTAGPPAARRHRPVERPCVRPGVAR